MNNVDNFLDNIEKQVKNSKFLNLIEEDFKMLLDENNNIKFSDIEKLERSSEYKDMFLNYVMIKNISIIYINESYVEDDYFVDTDYLDALDLYFKEISNFPILTKDQEYLLSKKAKNGDAQAKEFFINCNLKLVVSIAKSYIAKSKSLGFKDLIQEGNIGLMRAIDKFDADKGYKFSTYATWWINQSISNALKTKDKIIKIPYNKEKQLYKYVDAYNKLSQEMSKDPGVEDLSNLLGWSLEEVIEIQKMIIPTVSLDQTIKDEDDNVMIDFIEDTNTVNPEDYTVFADDSKNIKKVLELFLTEKEIEIIELRFGLDNGIPKSIKEISDIYNISPASVRQKENKVLRKLRQGRPRDFLREFNNENYDYPKYQRKR